MGVLKVKIGGNWVDVTGGPTGPGVVTGGTVGQVLGKKSSTDYDTQWQTPVRSGAAFPTANYDGERFWRTDYWRPFIWSAGYNQWMPDFVNRKVLRYFPTGVFNNISAAYVAWGIGPFYFTKYANATDLLIGYGAGGYVNSVGAVNYGVDVGAVHYGMGRFYYNQAGIHTPFYASRAILGKAAGTHTCYQLCAVEGGITLSVDANDTFTLDMEEVWPQSPSQ